MKVKNNRRTFFPTCGSDDNINIINKNLNITDVPVSEAVNGKLTAQEKTELKNLITQNGSTDVITSYINTKLQKESIENNNVVLNVERTTDEDSYMYDNVAILQNGIEVGAAGISYGTDELPYVERIDIYPEYQNKGIGTKALKLIADKYGDYLIAPDNQDAARLYARLGELVETDITSYIDQGYGVYEIYEGLKNNMNVNKLNEASYGGAYDIEDDMYFTKDDILEFTDELIDSLQDKGIFVDLVDTYITDGNRLVIVVEDEDGNEIDTDEFIDMRKIRRPKDIYKYKNIFIKDILSQYDELKSFNEDLDDEIKPREPQARKDYFGVGNFYHIGRKGDLSKDMEFIKSMGSGVTAELVYGDKSREYACKIAPNKWKTDSGKTLSDNDIASVAYDDGKATINYMIKNKPDNEFKSFNEDLDEIPVVDRLNFINKRRNGLPGITNISEFIDCLNSVGKDKFMVKETKAGSNLSLADLKDEWMTLKRKGWKWYTKNIPGDFLTYYVFEKINKGENMKEDLDISNMDNSFKYRLLDRMKSDCEYYINGAKSNKHLFMQNPQAQIKAMKDIYNSFSEKDVPEWISMEDINNYERQMCNPMIKNNMKENLVEDKNSYTLFDIDKLLCVTGAQYLGAKIPPAKRHCINEINIPHNMRYKYFKTTVEDYKDTIVLNWITQEPFNTADFEVFIKEVKSAFNQIIEDINYNKPFKVAVNVDCRDENCKKTQLLTFNKNNIKENLVEDDLYQLKAEVENEVEKYMTSEGFEPDEVKEYSAVDVYFDSKERDRVIVEVRAELSYDGLFELGLRLDKIIAKYDEDAYFEPEEPGITTAYIYNITPKKTNKRSKQIKEDYEDEPNYINDLYETLIQAQICIDKIKENYSSDVYNIIKLGIEQPLDEFMAHDENDWTMLAAIKESHEEAMNESICNYVDRYNNIVIYKCDGKYIATAINGKSVSGKSIDDVKSQLDKIDAEYTKHFRDLEEDKEDDDYYDDEDDENNNYPKNLPEQFYSLYDKLNGDFWTRKDELKQDIEEINNPKYSVEELNDEYVIVTDPEDDMHALQIFNGGTERTYALDFNHIRYL